VSGLAGIKTKQFTEALGLEALYAAGRDELEIATSDLNRPGLALTGFFDYFAADRVQIIGKHEMTYLTTALDDEQRYTALDRLMGRPFPCLILSRGMEPPQGLLQLAVKYGRPVFRSSLSTNKLISAVAAYLNLMLAPRVSSHGVLMDVYGVGLLITGNSGIGKSETALELIRRGHRLVADDLVELRRLGTDQLVGSAPENIRHFMEVRGIGIINVRQMFGIGSVMNQKTLEMITHMETWDDAKQYDRLGLTEATEEILEVRLPKLIVPVTPGRNLAIIMEVAARNHRLKNMGYNSAVELQRLINSNVDGMEDT
jgi:HPr kinase/phosphorylase